MNNQKILFKKFSNIHLSLWQKWIRKPHVKNTWFLDGYESPDYINEKIKGNDYDYPFVIFLDNEPIGYIQCSDLYVYRKKCPEPKGLFTNEKKGTFCIDLFIGEEKYLHKGYGTEIVKTFTEKIFNEFKAEKILIDPACSNNSAIRCYEKAGFKFFKKANDGVTDCCIMQKMPAY